MNPQLPEDRDPLWALLKRARPVQINPSFSGKVVRAAREAKDRVPAWVFWVRGVFVSQSRIGWAAAAVIVLGAMLYWQHAQRDDQELAENSRPPIEMADSIVAEVASELALLDEIDGLLEVTEAGELNEDDVGLLLF